jgi:hypothetical protein
MLIGVKCPDCGRGFLINGAGECKCGAYLVHHWRGKSKWVKHPDRAWVHDDSFASGWRRYRGL